MKITVFGSGYVGLVTGTCLAEHGHTVLCIDIDEEKIHNLQQGILPIYEPGLQELVIRNSKEGRLRFSTNAQEGVEFGKAIFNAVGTPPDKEDNDKADLTYIKQVAKSFGSYINGDKVFINKSTVPVGTVSVCANIISNELERRGVDHRFEVVSNPEFLREGAAIKDFMNPDRVVCGCISDEARDIMNMIYGPIMRSYRGVFFTDPKSAEIIKYASNAFLATKISFINEIANFSEKVGANILDIARGMGSDNRIGSRFLHAGIGYGGSCFPKDVKALMATGKEVGYEFKIINAADQVNNLQKKLLIKKVEKYLDPNTPLRVGIWGLAFKPKTDDIREAPSITFVNEVLTKNIDKIKLFDPVAMHNFKEIFPEDSIIEYTDNAYKCAEDIDILVILTEREEFRGADFEELAKGMRGNIVIDGRNIREKRIVEKFGLVYECIGR